MADSSLHVYEMTDEHSQQLVGGLLSGVNGLNVQLAASRSVFLLLVACAHSDQAGPLHQLVTSVDPSAVPLQLSAPTDGWAEFSVPA